MQCIVESNFSKKKVNITSHTFVTLSKKYIRTAINNQLLKIFVNLIIITYADPNAGYITKSVPFLK